LTDVATNHQVTNQQPNDYKEPINKSEDKVRGYNNTVNKYMSSDMEEKFISQNQFTDILATDTSQSKEEVHIVQSTTDTTVMEWNGYKKLPIH
jgi:RecB family endonuclease NucS